jgi:hypothetical protein
MSESAARPRRRHWYEVWYWECPICGSHKTFRERRYTRKPKDHRKRIHYEQVGCAGGMGCYT